MNITTREEGGKLIATLEGRLDTVAAEQAGKDLAPLNNNTSHDIVIDCTLLDYISSSGLRILLGIRKSAAAAGKSITILNISPEIEKVFSMTGFDTLFDIQKQ